MGVVFIIKLDLFKLHDKSNDIRLRNFIVAKGKDLKYKLEYLINDHNKTELVKFFSQKYKISKSSAEKLIYLSREWYPLIFIEDLLKLNKRLNLKWNIQDSIEYLKANNPPVRQVKACKILSDNLCKIAGAHAADGTLAKDSLIRITDYNFKNIEAFSRWFKEEFEFNTKIIQVEQSSQEFCIEFKNKVISRYFSKIFNFPIGYKTDIVTEPEIIKKSSLNLRKSFTLGAFTFEAGVDMKYDIALCVLSKKFRDSLSEILNLCNVQHVSSNKQSCGYWRLWSYQLNKDNVSEWMNFFEENTEKWNSLKSLRDGFTKLVNSYDEAKYTLNNIYPKKSANKIQIIHVLEIIKEEKEAYRYKIVEDLCKKYKLNSFGGKWGHSLAPHLKILEMSNIIHKEKKKFGKKKSFGSIIRNVYIYNSDIKSWRLPEI